MVEFQLVGYSRNFLYFGGLGVREQWVWGLGYLFSDLFFFIREFLFFKSIIIFKVLSVVGFEYGESIGL